MVIGFVMQSWRRREILGVGGSYKFRVLLIGRVAGNNVTGAINGAFGGSITVCDEC